MQSTEPKEDRWITVRIIAFRLEGHEGWWVEESDMTVDEARRAIADAGYKLIEIRELTAGSRQLKAGQRFEPDGVGLSFVHQWGWAYDEAADCWRAPGEALSELPGTPETVARIQVSYNLPRYGWLPIKIRAGRQSIEIHASAVFDPLPHLIRWLEKIADGESPRMTMDLEGTEAEWFVWPTDDSGTVRFAVTLTGNATVDGKRETKLDVLIGRRVLVSSIYRPLLNLWEGERFLRRLDHWCSASDDGSATDTPRSGLRSQRLDHYVAQ